MISVKDRIKQLRKETNFKSTKKKKKITEIRTESKKKTKKRNMKNLKKIYTKEFIGYLETLTDEEVYIELEAIEFIKTFSTRKEIYDRMKRENKIEKKREKELKKYLKSKKIKKIWDYDKYREKFEKREKKRMKKYKKKGLGVYDYSFNCVKLDEDKMISNIKKLTKEHKKRTDDFLDYVDMLFKGDVPDIMGSLIDKTSKISKKSKKYIKSLESDSILPGINFG